LTEKDKFVLSIFPDGTGFGNSETVSLTWTDHLSAHCGKLNLLLLLFVFKNLTTHFSDSILLINLSYAIQELFLVCKFNQDLILYLNIKDLHIFSGYLVSIFLSISYR
jgi:hypothetical protein